jgi:cytochrome c biogenesis protein CcmG/thiol:disulfide interchange protein DsbE
VLRLLAGGLAVVAVVVLIAAFYPSTVAPERGPLQVVGTRLPQVTLPALQGPDLNTNLLVGRPILVNVWATWCGPCRREMPALTRLAHAMGPRLAVIAIDQGEDPRTVAAYVRRFGVTFPVYVDRDQRVGTMLHIIGLPSSFFVDAHGVIRDAVDGEMTYDMMVAKASRVLAGS